MNKFTALLMFFLGASIMLQVTQAQDCTIGYYDIAPPAECEYYTDENGEEEEECSAVGSAAFAALLNSETATLSEPDFPLNDLDFTGDCDCTLRVYSGADLKGCSVQAGVLTESSESSEQITVLGDLWKRAANPRSFEVTCNF